MNKKRNSLLILGVLLIGILTVGGSYAFWTWESLTDDRTNVVFTATRGFSCAADGGGNITAQDVSIVPTECTNSENVIKREITPSVEVKRDGSIYMSLWLNVDSLGSYLSESENFKYALTSTDNSCESDVLTSGTFNGLTVGRKIELFSGTEYTETSVDTYYLWIWLDAAETKIPPLEQSAREFELSIGGSCSDSVETVNELTPVCSFENIEDKVLANSTTLSFVCIDENSTLTDSDISSSDISLSNSNITLSSDITKEAIDYGYRYSFTIDNALDTDEIVTLTIAENAVTNANSLGNTSATSKTLTVTDDNTAPVVTISNESDTNYTKDKVVEVTITDNVTGIASGGSVSYEWSTSSTTEPTEYTNSADFITEASSVEAASYEEDSSNGLSPINYVKQLAYTDGVSSIKFNATSQGLTGEYYLWIKPNISDVKGNVNNTSIVKGPYYFDNTGPMITFGTNGNSEYSRYAASTITVEDEHVSLNEKSYKYIYSKDNGIEPTLSFKNGESYSQSLGDSDYYLIAYACDSLGNCSREVSNVFKLDNTGPMGSMDVDSTDSTATVTLSVADGGVGLSNQYGYSISTSSTCNSSLTFVSSDSLNYTFTLSMAGEYYICSKVSDELGNISYIVSDKFVITMMATFEYTGDYQEYTVPTDGYYFVEAYGAQGGSGMTNGVTQYSGGKGGYASGYVYLNAGEQLYIYVGGKGNDAKDQQYGETGGYNGGGSGGTDTNYTSSGGNEPGPGGGGATDIRYFGSATLTEEELIYSSTLGLNSRIMVAGGGGGGYYNAAGGSGGNLISGEGSNSNGTAALKASQITGGSFGIGLTGANSTSGGGGGGGGYYGGGGGGSDNSQTSGSGAGGSSFISGYSGVNAITSSSDRTHTYNTLHYSGKYFIDGKMEAAVNEGNGQATITFFGTTAPERINEELNNVRYIKDCSNGNSVNVGNYWVEFQAIYNGINVAKGIIGTLYDSSGTSITEVSTKPYSYTTDGDISSSKYSEGTTYSGLQCFVIDLGNEYNLEEVAVWHYYLDGRTYYDNITYVSSDNSTWTEVINSTRVEPSNGKRVDAFSDEEIVDTTPPTVTLTNSTGGSAKTAATGATIVVTATDTESGVNPSTIYRYWGTTSYSNTSFTTAAITNGYTFTEKLTNPYWGNVYYKVCDYAGNCSNYVKTYVELYGCFKLTISSARVWQGGSYNAGSAIYYFQSYGAFNGSWQLNDGYGGCVIYNYWSEYPGYMWGCDQVSYYSSYGC